MISFYSDYSYLRTSETKSVPSGRHKILFIVRLLLFRLRERYSVATARHQVRYHSTLTHFSFITASSTSTLSYETICNKTTSGITFQYLRPAEIT